ncbi:MAG TPA: UDP-2,3-diacylglucosamine diphosphatase LpxI [Alphaproteobacteria bacterium]|nr:UDP-2,3-diacylglucosamine diphosphatase LpxI [Alphaproteobacteria bacterium]
MSAQPKLGILAGRGPLPAKVVQASLAAGREVFVIAFRGETEADAVAGVDHAWADIAAVGRTLRLLREAGVEDVVLIGPIDRPNFSRLRPDWRGARLLPKVLKAARRGDDAIMKVVVDDLESEGFRVLGAETVMTALAAPEGAMGRHWPTPDDEADIRRGIEVVAALGRLDIGQAAVVRHGYVLAVEAAEGTDAMLDRCVELRAEERGGVLVKLPKPGQERRADLPTIGVTTVERCAAAGLDGIAVAAGGALIDDREAVVAAADRLGLFVFGLSGEVVP